MRVVIGAYPVVSSGIRLCTQGAEDITTIGESDRAEELLRMVSDYNPDVVLIDSGCSSFPAVAVCKSIKAHHPDIAIVALVGEDGGDVPGMLGAGATSFVSRSMGQAKIRQEMLDASAHRVALDASLSAKLAEQDARSRPRGRTKAKDRLTKRELQILASIARGMRNRGIAVDLGLSERTVRGYMESIFDKLQVKTRTEAVFTAVTKGLIPGDSAGVISGASCSSEISIFPSLFPGEHNTKNPANYFNGSATTDGLLSLLDGVDMGLLITQGERLVATNKSLTNVLGYRTEELVGKHFTDIVPKELHPEAVIMHRMRLAGKTVPRDYNFTFVRKDGTSVGIRISIRVIRYDGGLATAAAISPQKRDVIPESKLRTWMQGLVYELPGSSDKFKERSSGHLQIQMK